MAKLNPDQFPVVRRTSGVYRTATESMGPARQYIAVHPETGRAVGTVTHLGEWWSTKSDADFDRIEADPEVRPGTDVPMVDHHPGVVEDFAVGPGMKGNGLGRRLLNQLVQDHWDAEGRTVGSIPNVSDQLSPDSAGVVEHYTGEKSGDRYWTDSSVGRQGRTESDEEYGARRDKVRRRRMNEFAKEQVEAAGDVVEKFEPGYQPPGSLVGGRGDIRVAHEPSTSFGEKLALVAAKDAPKERRKKSDDGQMRLPGF